MKRSTLGLLLVLAFALAPSLALAQGDTWTVPGDFATIQLAIDAPGVVNGDTIMVGYGLHAGAFVTKAVEIVGEEGATITSGPPHGSGLIQGFRIMPGGDGATISHLRFEVDLAIMNGLVPQHNVTVTHCTFINAVQAISNWAGNKWNITHNVITDLRTNCGGGIGILIGDYHGGIVEDNVVAHNKISGTLHVAADDCGDYNGTGIVLYADFRWGAAGAERIAYNRVVKNKVSLTSDNSLLVDVVAIELTDTNETLTPVIFNNAIGFNDLRDTEIQIALTPANLDNPINAISRNLGENRGHGLHPNVFGPGGN